MKNEKGVATLFVLISGLFFIAFIMGILILSSAKRETQLGLGGEAQDIYNQSDKGNVKNIVPIYTVEQLLKMGSKEEIAIEQEGSRKYFFSETAAYVLYNNIELNYQGILDLERFNFDKGKNTIKIRDTSKTEEVYYYYKGNYNYAVTKDGLKYDGLALQYDGIDNIAEGHSDSTQVWKDLSGNQNDGTLTNFTYSSTSKWNDNSLSFDGTNDYITIQKNPIYIADEYTMHFVVETNQSKNQTLFCNRATIGQGRVVFILSNKVRIDNGPTTSQWKTEYDVAMNTPIDICIVRDNVAVKLYINGELAKYNKTIGDKTGIHANISTIGASQVQANSTSAISSLSNYFSGKMYFVNIYNKALTEKEIENNYQATKVKNSSYITERLTELPNDWSSDKIKEVAKQGNRTAPIPVGYTVSSVRGEDNISEGLVIYEGSDEVTSSNHATALTSRNQYVWIPVDDINSMVMCKSNTGDSVCTLELQGNTLKCTNASHTSTATDLCGRLYGVGATSTTVDGKNIYQTAMNFADRSQTYVVNSGYREPDIVTSYDKDDATSGKNYMVTAGIADGKASTFQSQLTNDFSEMATSVAKYKGFYISRYEAGQNGASKKNQLVLTAASSASGNYVAGNMWYGIYNTLRNKTGVNTNVVKSHMIWRKSV